MHNTQVERRILHSAGRVEPNLEILATDNYQEYERFVASHPAGGITQSTLWHGVKDNWRHEVVVSRNTDGTIAGGVSVLIRPLPPFGTTMMYAPRGPVCDWHDEVVMLDLQLGINHLAKKHRAHMFKIDPEVMHDDTRFISLLERMGYGRFYGPEGFETIQARLNYRLYLNGQDEESLMADLTQQTRRNIRLARDKHGVEIRACGKEALADFMPVL